MRRAPCGEGLVADLFNAPQAPQLVELGLHLFQAGCQGRVEQIEVSKGPVNDIARATEAGQRQVQRHHRRARSHADLQRKHGRALEVRLHRARELAVGNAQGVGHLPAVATVQFGQAQGGAECTAHGRTKKAHGRDLRAAQGGGHVNGQNKRLNKCGARHRLTRGFQPLGMRHQSGQHGGHGMHHGRFMHAVKFLVVDLIGVEHGRSGRAVHLPC